MGWKSPTQISPLPPPVQILVNGTRHVAHSSILLLISPFLLHSLASLPSTTACFVPSSHVLLSTPIFFFLSHSVSSFPPPPITYSNLISLFQKHLILFILFLSFLPSFPILHFSLSLPSDLLRAPPFTPTPFLPYLAFPSPPPPSPVYSVTPLFFSYSLSYLYSTTCVPSSKIFIYCF